MPLPPLPSSSKVHSRYVAGATAGGYVAGAPTGEYPGEYRHNQSLLLLGGVAVEG